MVQETEKDGLERDDDGRGVNLEGDLKWVNREEEEGGGEGAEETEVRKEATVLEAAITESLFLSSIYVPSFLLEYPIVPK